VRSAPERDVLLFEGVVLEEHRGGYYRVECQLGALRREVLARASGRLVTNRIKILPGDFVEVEVSPYDMARGRITHRGRRGG
jgi:translation initiation factor IF-1